MLLDDLEIFYGDSTEQASHVYAQLATNAATQDCRLSGSVRGPFCEYARTLPMTADMQDLGPGQTLLARAMIPDPCFWSPEIPSLYHVHVELRRDGEIVETADRQLGIRSLGVRGNDLFLNGKRWVLRGVFQVADVEVASWRETATALLVEGVDEPLAMQASRDGILLVPRLTGDDEDVREQVRRLGRYASVGMVIVDSKSSIDFRAVAPNVLVARSVDNKGQFDKSLDTHLLVSITPIQGAELPVMIVRRYDGIQSVADGRRKCDELQRELAPLHFAGYIV